MDVKQRESAKENTRRNIQKLIEKLEECKTLEKYDTDDIDAAIKVLKLLPPWCPNVFADFKEMLIDKYHFDKHDLEEDFYRTSSTPLGYCLIINNLLFDFDSKLPNRHGSEVDERNLHDFFKKVGFEVRIKRNLTSDEMRECLTDFSKEDFCQVDSMIVVIMSHGGQVNDNEVVYGTDGRSLTRYNIYSLFNNRNHSLILKPKVFFFIACRGDYMDYGIQKSGNENFYSKGSGALKNVKESLDSLLKFKNRSADAAGFSNTSSRTVTTEIIPNLSDILIVSSALPYTVTVRNSVKGTYFCQFLIPVLNEYHEKEDLETLIKRVNRKMEGIVTEGFRITQAVHYESVAWKKSFWLCRKS